MEIQKPIYELSSYLAIFSQSTLSAMTVQKFFMNVMKPGISAFFALFLLTSTSFAQQITQYDILITNGKILDGSGTPWFYGDIGINGDKIIAIGQLKGKASGKQEIDASGLTITPGFIDIHSHGFDQFRPGTENIENEVAYREAPNLVAQGVTTIVTNHDGRSPLSIKDQISLLESNGGVGVNTILLIGHGAVRGEVMGRDFQRPATESEIQSMKQHVKRAMEEGAWGMSAAPEYSPAIWSTTDELAAVVSEMDPFNGVLIEHERSSGMVPMWYYPSSGEFGKINMIESIIESIEIAERTGVKVVASHIKARGQDFWGTSTTLVRLINDARKRGVEIYADQYPYNTSGSDGSTTLIPPSVRRGGRTALQNALSDPNGKEIIRKDIAHEITRRGGSENILVMDYPDETIIGKSIFDLTKQWNISAVDVAIKLALEGNESYPGGARLRGFSMSEMDLEIFAKEPWMATASDGEISIPSDNPLRLHARYYGTFPKKIRHFALNEKILSLEQAIVSMTSLPAQIMDIKDRGLLKEGYFADLVMFDEKTIQDKSTFFDIHQYPEGIPHVLVNGQFVVRDFQLTKQRPGRLLRKK